MNRRITDQFVRLYDLEKFLLASVISLIFFLNLFSLTKCRLQHEAELKRLEEETAQRIEEAVRKNVEERMKTEEVKEEIERRTKEAYEKMFLDVEIQLKKEKEAALNEARRKEVSLASCLFNFAALFVWFSGFGILAETKKFGN
jgi:C4-dicarboxylate-specific signal transduction histidine kinase